MNPDKMPQTKKDIDEMLASHEAIEQQSEELNDALAAYVAKCFGHARDSRQASGVDERIIKALRRRRREYDPEDLDLVAETANIYIPIIDLKCRAALSWMTDILANAEEQPWTMSPTPNPEIPDNIREVAIDNLKEEILALGISDIGQITELAKKYKALAQQFVDVKASDATTRMETLVRDKMLEGGWLPEYQSFLDDVTTYPSAIMEAPIIRFRKQMKWRKNKIVTEKVLTQEMERVDPNNVFPSFDSTNCQNGSYIILRKRLTYSFLYECKDMPGFNEEVIRELLEEFQHRGTRVDVNTDSEEDVLKERNEQTADSEYIEALAYYGVVKGQLLIKNGVLVDDPQRPYESVIWTINNRTIYAILNAHPLGVRPLYSTSFKKVTGSFWGEALPDILETVERMANAAARALARNMAYSSGAFGEYDITRLAEDEEQINVIEPGRLYRTEPSMTGGDGPAFRFHNIDSHAGELQGITESYLRLADDISGVPAYVLGNPNVAGAGRTMGGLSMLMGNAAKGIKQVIHNIDQDMIAPIVTVYYNYELIHGTDESAKVDAQVIARGSSGILQRELSQSRTVELLQVLTPYAGNIPPEGMNVLLREILKSRGYNVDDIIPDPKRGKQLSNILAQQQGQPNSMPGTPPPPLDGRNMPPTSPDVLSKLPQPTNMPIGN